MIAPDGVVLALHTPTLESLARIEQPTNAQQVADLLRASSDSGQVVIPVGGGGALEIGNLAPSNAIGLSTRSLNSVIDYQPTDMTLSVQAGATLADIQAVLGEHGQALPIEAVDPATATIGGLLATALAGPRRYGGGTLRDVLIGISVAYPDGTVGKAGGLVVKNVSGFDMMRVHHGALGTLGVIISANFKVLPTIRSEFTASWSLESNSEVQGTCEALRSPDSRPTALIARTSNSGWSVHARFEGRSGGLQSVARRIESRFGKATLIENAESADLWASIMADRRFESEDRVRVRVGVRPTDSFNARSSLNSLLETASAKSISFEIEPGVGVLYGNWDVGSPDHEVDLIRNIQSSPEFLVSSILAAPDEIKEAIDIWGIEPDTIQLMRRLKSEYDPAAILNRGRFAGKI